MKICFRVLEIFANKLKCSVLVRQVKKVSFLRLSSWIFFSFVLFLMLLNLFILGPCAYSSASKAFVFSLYNVKGYNPVKLTQYQNQQNAMYKCYSYGPTFGSGHDIRISDDAKNNQNSYTVCGHSYSNPTGYSGTYCGFFTGSRYFSPTDIEVFFEITN